MTSDLKQKHRAMWASGEYDAIARGIRSVADHLVRVARIRAGERVLDVACGTGNTALVARARGADVTALDLTPELLAVAEQRAAREQLGGIAWTPGDAEALPFPDASFDVVTSSCGLMFAPDQRKVASELARVTKRGGRVAIQAWTREGGLGKFFALTARHVPPPPGLASPFEWGDEAAVRRLLGGAFGAFEFERYDCPEFGEAPEQIADLFIGRYGPTHRAHASLAPDKAAAYRADFIEFLRGYVCAADGKVRWGREYLITVATRS
ncbi:MAG: class I SAM-dependent methyltransferase [Planctomycetota bacterium]|nr:MAG: class I SAM-dependent methyltransferase [Planctomycetota bacterium]